MAIRIYYVLLRIVSGLRYALALRSTAAGRLALACLVASAILGMDTTKNAAHEAFTLIAALIIAPFITNRRFRPALTVHRVLPKLATAGRPFSYILSAHNTGNKPLSSVVVRERFADPRPSLSEFRRSVQTGIAKGDRWIKDSMFRHWRSFLERNLIAEPVSRELTLLPAQGTIELRMDLLPLRRGRLHFEAVTLGRSDPLGLFRTLSSAPAAQSVLVLPRRYPTPTLRLAGGRKYHQGGISLASNVGDADEFISLRDYRHGDPLRKIHWKSWARTGKPVVKEYADEFFTRHALILDTFAREEDRVFEEALSVASSFLTQVETNDSLLDLMFIGTEAYCFTTGRSMGQAEKALEVIACARPCADKTMRSLEELVFNRAALLSSCICVLLAWDAERQDFVRKLKGFGIPVKVILVREPAGQVLVEPGPMRDSPGLFHVLDIGRIEEGMKGL